jgi:hypothetical protein
MSLKAILAISILANVLLGALALRSSSPTPEVETVENIAAPVAPKPKVVKQMVTNTVTKRITWEMVESGDYKEYIANLRSIGCPEETIRDIIIADVNKLYDRKKKEAKGDPKKFEFWKGGNPFMASMDSELMKKLKALDDEKNAVLRALGITPDTKSELASVINPFETMMDFLPEDKKARVVKIMSDMQSKMMEASKDGADTEAMGKAMKDMETALKGVLTPQEYLDYQLRFSMTANMMRSQMTGFDPNEGEFMKVFTLREAFDSEYSPMSRGNENEEQRKAREAAEKKLKEDIKTSLGAQRYAEYERAQDWNFQQIYRAAKKADLDTAEAVKVYDMKKAAETATAELRNNKDLTQEQRTQALQGIQQQTEASVKAVLGEKGWDQYNRGNNTYWIKNIHR